MPISDLRSLPDELANLCCSDCGSYEASLRYSAHPVVVSTFVATRDIARIGIYCARCRGIRSAKAIAISLLAGWWSVRGPSKTLAAVRCNWAGGQQNRNTNAQMLRAIARREVEAGNPELACLFARAAHEVQPQRENSQLLEHLSRVGIRREAPPSLWRFVPAVTLVIFGLLFGGLGLRMIGSRDKEPVPTRRANFPTVPANQKVQPLLTNAELYKASADELEKMLRPDADERVAPAYFRARLTDLEPRIRRGEDLTAVQDWLSSLPTKPGMGSFLTRATVSACYDKLTTTLSEVTRYYHGGAPVDAIERTTNETFNVAVDRTVDAINAGRIGHTDQSNAAVSEADARLASIAEMKRDLQARGAVIARVRPAIKDCLDAAR